MLIDGAFGPWRPDLPEMNNVGVTVARNVIPAFGNNGVTYRPIRSAALYSNTSMVSRPRGTGIGRATNGDTRVYAGCREKLYKLDSLTKQWQDASKSGGYLTSDNDNWSFTDWGNLMIATNFSDNPQYIAKDTNTTFGDLTTLVRAKYSALVRDFNVFAYTYDSFDLDRPYRVRWSAFGDPFDYNFSPSTMSDFQDVFDGGSITGLVGGEAGYILMQNAIVKMNFIGAPLVFEFIKLPSATGKGCIAPKSVITVQGMTFYLSSDGFYMLEGDQVQPIGAGKVNNWFQSNTDTAQYNFMTAAADPQKNLVYWTFVGNGGALGVPNQQVIYNYQTGEWTEAEAPVTYVFNSISLPMTIEELDVYGAIENIPAPFDSPVWAGGNQLLWGMDAAGKIYTFGGPNLEAIIETQERFVSQEMRAMNPNIQADRTTIVAVRPIYHGSGTCSVMGRYRNTSFEALTDTTTNPTNAETQFAYFRYQGRFHRWQFVFQGEWDKAVSYQIDAIPAGSR